MFKSLKLIVILGGILIFGLALSACAAQATTAAPQPQAQAPAPTQACPAPTTCPEVGADVPFFAEWAAAGHAKKDSPAFTHWDTATPAEVPTGCAKCHSSGGFLDYVGADGSAPFAVDKAAPIGTVITCKTCHNETTAKLTTVKFPSGAEVSGLGGEAVCMTCHQGTASSVQVDETLKAAGLTDDDTVVAADKKMGFLNIHYFAAAVSRYGKVVKGGYEYPGKAYDALFDHVEGVQACTDCHESHSLELKLDSCSGCHQDVKTVEDVANIRMLSSTVDYDGDGDVKEGIKSEIDGMREMLYTAIQAYAKEVAKSPIVYSAETYPYFFIDTNADGKGDKDELQFANSYKAWTGRLEKAAFNYQTSVKDPGGYAHGGKYIIELLYDSIDDLNTKISTKVDLSKAHRTDVGHFDGSSEAFRHWDEEGEVAVGCVKCHTGMGLPQYLKNGANVMMEPSNGLMCETCHNDLTKFTRYEVATVTFPSGAKIGFEKTPDDNLCLNCHQGRESTVSVNRAVGSNDPDTIVETLTFRNVHYFAAGATLFGTEAKGVYEYKGKEYVGRFNHDGNLTSCTSCHDTHGLEVKVDSCKGCHQVDDPALIRMATNTADSDGDGDVKEGVKGELEGLQTQLYAAIQAYAKDVVKKPIVYSPASHPYFFVDTNANGAPDPDEVKSDNSYNKSWTPRLLEAAYNYQYSVKDPGAYVHNAKYVMQVLYDSIADLKTKVPAVELKGTRP